MLSKADKQTNTLESTGVTERKEIGIEQPTNEHANY